MCAPQKYYMVYGHIQVRYIRPYIGMESSKKIQFVVSTKYSYLTPGDVHADEFIVRPKRHSHSDLKYHDSHSDHANELSSTRAPSATTMIIGRTRTPFLNLNRARHTHTHYLHMTARARSLYK